MHKLTYNPLIRLLITAIAIVIALVITWENILSGCIPYDEGLLGHSAFRFFNGELPHIDFDDPYTGLLSLIHSAAFRVGGVAISSLRYQHYLIFSIVLLLFSWYLRDSLSLPSAVLTIVAYTLWSIIIYPTAMPTWYVSYLVFFASLIIVKSRRSPACLLLAGVFLGLGTLIKINAVFFLIAAQWGVAYLGSGGIKRQPLPYERFVICALYILTNILFAIVLGKSLDLSHLVYFFLPNFVLITFILKNLISEDISSFCKELLFLSTGYILTIGIFILFFYLNNGLLELANGVIFSPMRRIESAQSPPPHWFVVISIFLVVVVATNMLRKEGPRSFLALVIVAFLGLSFNLVSGNSSLPLAFMSILPPVLVISIFVFKTPRSGTALFWLLMATFGILIQYPFYSTNYVGYTTIFSIIALMLSIFSGKGEKRTVQYRELASIILLLGGIAINERNIEQFPQLKQDPPYCISDQLLDLIKEHSGEGDSILAFPDSPEVYFYSGRKNPTREIFNFLSSHDSDYRKYYDLVKDVNVPIVVINRDPSFSKLVEEDLVDLFRTFYLKEKVIGKYLVLFCRIG